MLRCKNTKTNCNIWLHVTLPTSLDTIYSVLFSRCDNYLNKDIVKINIRNEIQCGMWSTVVAFAAFLPGEHFVAPTGRKERSSSNEMKVLKIDVIWWMIYIHLMNFHSIYRVNRLYLLLIDGNVKSGAFNGGEKKTATENWTSIKAYAEIHTFFFLYRGNFLVNFIKLKRVEKREQRNEWNKWAILIQQRNVHIISFYFISFHFLFFFVNTRFTFSRRRLFCAPSKRLQCSQAIREYVYWLRVYVCGVFGIARLSNLIWA